MKTEHIILLSALAAGAYLFFRNKGGAGDAWMRDIFADPAGGYTMRVMSGEVSPGDVIGLQQGYF